MKNIKKKWEQELNTVLPPLREDVRQAPIQSRKEKVNWFSGFLSRKGVLSAAVAMAALLCVILPSVFIQSPAVPTGHPAAVMVEINPSVVFSVDEKGKVTNVVAANADGDMLLADEERHKALLGIPIDQAVEHLVTEAVQLGYLDLDEQSVIRVSSCEEEGRGQALSSTLQKGLEDYFRRSGAYVAVVTEQMDVDGFCQRSGFEPFESITGLLSGLSDASMFYFERHQESWEQSYTEALDIPARLEEIVQRLMDLPFVSDGFRQKLLEDIHENLQTIFSLLEIDLEKLRIFEIPTSGEEYLQRLRSYYEEKMQGFETIQPDQREQISDEDYEGFIAELIAGYGSLQAYWESKK